MSRPDPSPAAECPQGRRHTLHPLGYAWHGEWAEQMMLTHRQMSCSGCGLLVVWDVQPGVSDLSRPALYTGHCSRCGSWYDEGSLIRTDDQGGWIAGCCLVVADA